MFAANTLVVNTCLSVEFKSGIVQVDGPTIDTEVDCGTSEIRTFDIGSVPLFATAKLISYNSAAVITGVVVFPRYDKERDCTGFGAITSPVEIALVESLPQAF